MKRALLIAIALLATPLVAQETAIPAATSSNTSAMLMNRMVALHLDHVPLREALTTLAKEADFELVYVWQTLPADRTVTLITDRISVRDALTVLLRDTGIEPVVTETGRVRLRPADGTAALGFDRLQSQGTATLSGSVTDSGTGATISQVTIHIDGTSLTAKSSADGQYQFTNIAAGEYRMTARRVGYLAKTRAITLADGDNRKLDFGLNPPATQLNEVVTTALGEQRRYEVGNVISTINVDSIAPNAPVTSVTDLISGRAPGVEIMESSGLVGSGEDIRIRGISSLLLQSDPIIIVDGIRVDNTPGGNNPISIATGGPAPARINDLDFNEIESISVLKGPTATTEYGTDAANGVIVITTKRGQAGAPRWDASATESAEIIPQTSANYYWDWGHLADGTAAPLWIASSGGVPCNMGAMYFGQPPLTAGSCTIDSITAFNPLDHGATTEYGTGPINSYDLSVGGGSEQVWYYLAGGIQNAQGVVHIPDVFRSQAAALGYPNSALNPNSQNQERLTANGTIQLSPKINVNILGGYTSTYMEGPSLAGVAPGDAGGPVLDDSAFEFGYGSSAHGYLPRNGPLALLGQSQSQATEAWRGGGDVDWAPAPWLGAHLTAGIQHEAQTDGEQILAQSAVASSNYTDSSGGQIGEDQVHNDTYTIDLATAATLGVSRYLRLTTTFGAQYVQSSNQGLSAQAFHLSAGAFSLIYGNSANEGFTPSASSSATEGVYAEEQLNFVDRCYMPLALRIDAGNAFGSAVGSQNYPKWALSCRVLSGATELRLRGSYGASGVQPPQGSAASTFFLNTGQFGYGQPATVYTFADPGNPNLRPEDDQGWEVGADFGVWAGRLSLGITVYNQYKHNALYTVGLGYSLQGSYTENVGDIRNLGDEVELTVVPLEGRALTASVNLSGSLNRNKLLRLAPNILSTNIGGAEWFVAGYPLYGYFGDSVRYADVNRDGILESNEVYEEQGYTNNPPLYMGSSIPVTQMAAQTSVAIFRRQLVQVNAVFQYQGGYKIYNTDGFALTGQDVSVLGTPLWLQAYDQQAAFGNQGQWANAFLDGSYLSWNELSVALRLPAHWGRALRVRNPSVVLGVNNLALWTAYPFGDPRVSNGAGVSFNQPTFMYSANNDIRSTSATVVPLTRLWTIKLNLGL